MYVVKEQERRVRSCLFFPFLHVLWPLLIGISLGVRPGVWEHGCKWQRTRFPAGRTRAVVGWKEPRVQNRKKQVFTGLCERLSKYQPALCLVIELWFRGAVPLAKDEQERGLNRENQTWMSSIIDICQVCLVLKRCKSCQFICFFLSRIRVVKEGRSTLC